MELTSLLARARLFAEDKMTDTATISRGGSPVFDPDTGILTPSTSTVYSGSCNITMPNATEVERLFGDEQVTATRFLAWFPWDTTGVQIDDLIIVTDSLDADLLDVTLRVVAVPRASHPYRKAFGCEVVES